MLRTLILIDVGSIDEQRRTLKLGFVHGFSLFVNFLLDSDCYYYRVGVHVWLPNDIRIHVLYFYLTQMNRQIKTLLRMPDSEGERRHLVYVLLAQVETRFQAYWTSSQSGTPILSTLISLELATERDIIDWAKRV
jgi:hypothetical protein